MIFHPFAAAVAALAATLLHVAPGARAADAAAPNVVVIMADDIGLGDLSHYHRQRSGTEPVVETPHIDALIAAGLSFTDAHSPASLCAPTRFSMLTGNYSYRNDNPWGVWSPWADAQIDPQWTTVARIAKAGGYRTSFFGKWGLGGMWAKRKADFARIEAGALSFGFDHAFELPQGIQNPPYAAYENRAWMKLADDSELITLPVEQTGYDPKELKKTARERRGKGDSNWDPSEIGPLLAERAVTHIAKLTAETTEAPFYLYYCSQAVHVPHAPSKQLNGEPIAGTTPGKHGDMIRELDAQVGAIVAALKAGGVYENTLLIFTSDNGGLVIDRALIDAGHVSSNGLRGKKGAIHEGGHRVPFVAVWPGHIAPGSTSHEPIVGHDTVATIAALAGQAIDREVVKDSANLLPIFRGESTGTRHSVLMHRSESGPSWALREGAWKLILEADYGKKEKKQYKKIYYFI